MKYIYRLSFLLSCLFALSTTTATGQLLGNEWIDYNKTYYKFKVATEGLYRISKSTLDAAGIPGTTVAAQFVLYRDGQEVPLYISVPAGGLGSSDYIEFYGYGPNGKLDKQLYHDTTWHINENISLFTDTACYYLTYDNQPGHLRYAQVTNGIPGVPPTPEPYCWFSSRVDYKNQMLPGNKQSADLLFAAQFDVGEAYVNSATGITNPASVTLQTPNYIAGGPAASINLNVAALTTSAVVTNIKVLADNQQIHQEQLILHPRPSAVRHFQNLLSIVNGNTTTISYDISLTPTGFNRFGTALAEVVYPRNYDLSGLNSFKFRLKANSANQYLEFANFNNGGGNPRIYDLTNKKWYTGDIQGIKTRFYLDPSLTDRELLLVAMNSNIIQNITPVKTINFTNYTVASNQGNYVIITHNALRQTGNGQDYIQQYKDYRSSAAGGGYSVVVADVNELYDQFAYGYDIHPLSIKHFLQYAYNNWSPKPEYALLLGRGLVYHSYKNYLLNQSTYPFPIVPTYGDPGSDVNFVNFGSDFTAKIKLGRISAWNGSEIGNYLNKVKLYEAEIQQASLPTYATELWKKNFLHIAGGSDIGLQGTLLNNLNAGKRIIEDTFSGAYVSTVAKNTTSPIDQIGSAFVDSMIENGTNWITFHGHASAGNFDFNLNNPEKYSNSPRFPTLLGLGCDVSQIYSLSVLRTISERYINAPNGGAISVIAQDNLGYPNFHDFYLRRFYRSIASVNYNSTIGTHYNQAYDSTLYGYNMVNNPNLDMFTEVECMILLGDPAVKVYSAPKPDYHIADESLSTAPSSITTSLDSFQLKIKAYNLGRAIQDTVFVKVEHVNPAGPTKLLGTYPVANLYNIHELLVMVPIDKGLDLGLNKYRVTIDATSKYDEESENNNVGTLSLFIFSDKLIPVYPPEFSIVGQQGVTLKASTLNPFKPTANYKIEIDTTELFNSSQLQQHTTTSMGGVIKWQPSLTYKDSVVYYWRAALDSGNGSTPLWTTSSFIYLPQKSGWNQSHYFQYLKDNFSSLALEENRRFGFTELINRLVVSNVVLTGEGSSQYSTNDSKVMLNDVDIQRGGCPPCEVCAYWGSIQIMVFDSATGKPWENAPEGSAGAFPRCNNTRNSYTFEYMVHEQQYRDKAAHLLDSIPNGSYVLIRNFVFGNNYQNSFAQDWETGPNTLYNSLKDLGFTIDSFDKKRVFIMFRKKGNNTFPLTQVFSAGTEDKIEVNLGLPTTAHEGRLLSKEIGPAKQWETMKWRTSTYDNQPLNDSIYVKVSGVDNSGNETFLFATTNTDTSLANISAGIFPKLKLEWYSKDSISHSSSQLEYWRVHYQPLPEAALNPSAHYVFKDSLHVGQTAQLSLAIEELAGLPMDSMLVKYRVIDANGATHHLADSKYGTLNGNDTLHAGLTFDPSAYPGQNFLFIEANPNNDQPEQYHPNNLGYIPFRVEVDKFNPLIDVTFDGVHILDRDIVSARPFIKMTLKDENNFLPLDDTSLVSVSILYKEDADKNLTGQAATPVPFDGTTCKFVPAKQGDKNEAVIEFKPTFLQDGIYELAVNGKDKSGNKSGLANYRVSFEVINKSTITNILNYPNPFSTSTAFCFTVTGWMLPSQFKIQIMTVTGKVVREITKAELGPLHIGRNITEYKWDGKDQYGQLLGNGVYLYRVVTSISGEDIEHRESGADKFTKKGWGKMYIMR